MSLLLLIKISVLALVLIIVFWILSLFELYTQIGRYKHYWERNNQKPSSANEILYVALGDSTAQGIGATHPRHSYVGLVSKELEKKNYQPVRTINLSKSGAKVEDVINYQLPELKKLQVNDKTVITIEIGANDMINFNNNDFEKSMDQLMSQLPKQTLISDIPYFGDTRYKNKQSNVEVANKIMYRLANKNGFELVPLHDRVKENGGYRTLAIDWFHPSNTAYKENWSHVFIKRLNSTNQY